LPRTGPRLVDRRELAVLVFTKYLPDYLSDEEYAALQEYLCEHPDAGDVVRGSGGVRKMRWARSGAGKSGGVRLCYFVRTKAGRILMLTIYAKGVQDSIPGHLLKAIKEELEHGQDE
jgi:mRNA-degrading endonuclease RelE of RelBE toxin-antitoxin system